MGLNVGLFWCIGFIFLLLVHLALQEVWRPGVAVAPRWVGGGFLLFHCFDLGRPIVVGVVIWGWCLLNVGLFWCIGFIFLLLVHLGVQQVWRPGVAVVSRWVGCVLLLFHCFDLVP